MAACCPLWENPEARFSWLGIAGCAGLVLTGATVLLADARTWNRGLFLALSAAGCLVASLQSHPYRRLGLIPFAALGQLSALTWGVLTEDPQGPCLLVGFCGTLAIYPLGTTLREALATDARWRDRLLAGVTGCFLLLGFWSALLAPSYFDLLAREGTLRLLISLSGTATLILFWKLRRPAIEQFLEIILTPIYRFRVYGPGADKVPRHGPLLVIANHTSWFDPFWLGKVLPRPIIPMMGSDFYDLPIIRPLMIHVVGTIRVQTATFRREAPELKEAIAALDRGACVILFPEGRLRRVPEPSVRQFGRGVWHILSQRPETPVVICWIEGGWGSFASYAGGKPLRNKWPDWWRRIDIGISEPQVLDPELLKDQRATRTYLMRACLQARGYLGLEVPGLKENGDEEG